jgi:hypothetical protein
MPLDDQQFLQFMGELKAYLDKPKMFVTNIDRAREFYNAVNLAKQLFPDDEITIQDDPLQTGAMILHIEAMDFVVRGEREINIFTSMIALANNFEIYSKGKDKIHFAAVFRGVNKRV